MIQSAEDFLILPMKKPCNQGDSGTSGVQMPFGVPLFSLLRAETGLEWAGRLHPPLAPQEGQLKGLGNR